LNSQKMAYRSDIDGLRAIAVLAVIANHLPEEFLPSGFLGVDVFFVISGFVVSASILGRSAVNFSGFYLDFLSRRVKRLMPALIVCVAITGIIVFSVDPFPRNSIITGIFALFGVSNMALINLELDYFSPSSKFNAFTHTWSLGVEEQFYIAFPLIIWLTYFGRLRRRQAVLGITIALVSVLSLGFFLWLYNVNQVAAYYLMPTRFWELGAGVLVYLASTTVASTRLNSVVAFVSPALLALLVACFFAPQHYASQSTLAAVGLTGLLLFNTRRNITSRVLSLPPAVYIGKISYSLYLWHWPVVALGPLVLSPDWRISTLYVATMGVAAIFSHHLIEKPLRVANWSGSKTRDIAIAFACSFALSVAAVVYALLTIGIKEPSFAQHRAGLHPPAFLSILNSGLPYETCVVDDQRPMTPATFDQCTIPPAPGSGMPMIWAMGDSHAAHLQGLLYELHRQHGFGVHLIATPGNLFPHGYKGEYPPRQMLFNKVLDMLKPGDIVLVARFYLTRTNPTKPHDDIPQWINRVSSLAKELEKRGVTLIVTGPPPTFTFIDVRECDIAEREICAIARAELVPPIETVMNQLHTLQSENTNLRVFDMFVQVCPPTAEFCFPDDGISFLFRDRDHFNSLGSKRLAEPFLNFLQSAGVLNR
jgi:peptidoglycan/LPS O-acetylase OafA/YrhL